MKKNQKENFTLNLENNPQNFKRIYTQFESIRVEPVTEIHATIEKRTFEKLRSMGLTKYITRK